MDGKLLLMVPPVVLRWSNLSPSHNLLVAKIAPEGSKKNSLGYSPSREARAVASRLKGFVRKHVAKI